ncbi:type III-B CRISPR module RAMP protein Cmr6 [Methylocaldum szegediense]|uniref:CRISPR-associated protein Cmr6 n=1 Tax=Methylocaldum szegediense TaxID=73780 RepID=A0ABM9HYI5_9GAMM|nr:type III-B CRISPR module RAMP protein Cmr6 [Methylocaldum szegediense]CAI8771412.1 CRISPR-associated protein Cmr6 [Methylocaldum szegediense]
MAQPAVPDYLTRNTEFSDCPPGHRYTLYGAFWEPERDWKRVENVKPEALNRMFRKLPDSTLRLRDAVIERQYQHARQFGERVLTMETESVSPFVTGTGIEHPLENGMAFLNPYGLPYLPGSGVKGVLRKAAEELRDDLFGEGTQGWNQAAIDCLFGKETEDRKDDHTRGALSFWDVFPRCDSLAADIMNPHYGPYYQEGKTPADCYSPKPIFFLTVPAKTPFTFHVVCDISRLPADWPEGHWQDLLRAAFAHAFDWLGFGAKTAVGYGALKSSAKTGEPELTEAGDVIWENARVSYSVNTREMVAEVTTQKAIRREAKELFDALRSKRRQEKAKNKELIARVRVRLQNGTAELLEVLPE